MTGQMMPPPTGWMWGGFFEWQLRDKDGNIEQEGGGPNMLHQLGQQEVLNAYFAPDIATVLESDAIYDVLNHADGSKCIHSASGTDDPFATVTAGDMVYIAGGAAAAEMVPGLYEVASVGVDYENILLARDPGADQLTGGLVVLSLNRGMGVIEPDASFDLTGHEDGEICLYSTAGTQDSFVGLAAGDMLYLVGGLDNEVTPGLYEVASVGGDYENVLLTAAPYAGDVTGGIVVFRVLQKRLALALDNRSALSVTDTAAGLASYEEDGDGYARVVLDPMDSATGRFRIAATKMRIWLCQPYAHSRPVVLIGRPIGTWPWFPTLARWLLRPAKYSSAPCPSAGRSLLLIPSSSPCGTPRRSGEQRRNGRSRTH